MAYFEQFPKGKYDILGNKNYKLVTDLFRRIKIRDKIKDVASLYSEYTVQNGERPEHVAMKHFGNSQLHWVILITNGITDAYYDWPLSLQEFEEYLLSKYESHENINAIHHYERTQGSGPQTSIDYSHLVECNSIDSGALEVTNKEYEERLQAQKSRIKLINTAYLPVIIQEFERLMNE